VPWDSKKTRQQRGYGRQHERIREELIRDVILCEECMRKGIVTVGTHADHIVPKASGGSDDRENYQLLCAPCHKEKTIRENGGTPRPTFGLDGWPIG
jgi:5-methylcytosine-specific restriction protein A